MAKGQGNAAFKAQLIIPEHRQLYEYWLLKAAGRPMPDKRDISPSHIPRLLPNISLIEVEMPGERYRVRLAGTRLRDVHDCETTGLYLDELDWGDKRDYWLAAYHRIAEEGKPAQGVVRGPRTQKEHLVQFWLKLPLTHGGDRVGMVLCYDAFLPGSEVIETIEEKLAAAR
ncbi:MAG TPA: PAS domain-containing protein [Nordella sp.]|nr:PAS domain-containing protein [Nordella sp.]